MSTTPTVYFDTINDAQYSQTGTIRELVRTGWIEDIPIDNDPDPLVLAKVQSYLPAFQTGIAGLDPSMVFQKLVVLPITGDKAKFRMTYSNDNGLDPTSYIITDDSYVENRITDLIPGLRIPIVQNWQQYDMSGLAVDGTEIPIDTLKIPVSFTLRTIKITRLSYGKLPAGLQPFMNYVNADPWVDYDPGYWKVIAYRSQQSKYSSGWQTEATAMTRTIEDWSEIGLMTNKKTGRTINIAAKLRADVNALPYAYGFIWPSGGIPDHTGIVRVGPFPMASFNALFGFSTLP